MSSFLIGISTGHRNFLNLHYFLRNSFSRKGLFLASREGSLKRTSLRRQLRLCGVSVMLARDDDVGCCAQLLFIHLQPP